MFSRSGRFWLVVILFVGAAIGMALLATPWVQREIVVRLAGLAEDTSLAAGHLAVGPRQIVLREVEFHMPGLKVVADVVVVRHDLWALLRRGVIRIEELQLRGLEVEVVPRALRLPPSEYFPGVLEVVRLGRPLELGRLVIDGEVGVLSEGERLVTLTLGILGGDTPSGEQGSAGTTLSLQLHEALAAGVPSAPIVGRGVARWEMDGLGGFRKLVFEGGLDLPRVMDRQPPGGRFSCSVEASPRGEVYKVELDPQGEPSLTVDAVLVPIARQVTAEFEARGAGLWLGLGDPRLAVLEGELGLSSRLDLVAASARGEVRAILDLPEPGRVHESLEGRPSLRLAMRSDFFGDRSRDWALQDLSLKVQAVDENLGFEVQGSASRKVGAGELAGSFTLAQAWLRGWAEVPEGVLPMPEKLGGRFMARVGLDGALEARLEHATAEAKGGDEIRLDASVTGDWLKQELEATLDLRADLPAWAGPRSPRFRLVASASGLPGNPQPGPTRWELLDRERGEVVATIETLGGWMPPLAPPLTAPAGEEVARVRLSGFDLATLPGARLGGVVPHGRIVSGSWVVRGSPAEFPGIEWMAEAPVVVEGFGLAGVEALNDLPVATEGDLEGSLNGLTNGTRLTLQVAGGRWRGTEGVVASLDAQGTVDLKTMEFGVQGEAKVELPDGLLPGGRPGALTASLGWQGGSAFARAVAVNRFDLDVDLDGKDLASVRFPEVAIIVVKEDGEFIAATEGTIAIEHAEVPLDWLQPGGGLQGSLGAGKWTLQLEPRAWVLASKGPVSMRLDPPVGAAAGSTGLEVGCSWRSEGLAYLFVTGERRLISQFDLVSSDLVVTSGGIRAGGGALKFGAMADISQFLPSTIDTSFDLDLGALARSGFARGLPAAGTFMLQAKGGLLGSTPLLVRAELVDVRDAAGVEAPGPFVFEAEGSVGGRERKAYLDTRLTLGPEGDRSDLAFRADADLNGRKIRFDTALRGSRLDLAAVRRFAEAFPETEPETEAAPAPVSSDVATEEGVTRDPGKPFWRIADGSLRLDLTLLEVGTLRAEGLTGLVDISDDGVAVTKVAARSYGGTMTFDGRLDWAEGDEPYRLSANLRIDDLQAGRALPAAADGLAALDLPLDLVMAIDGRGEDLWSSAERAAIEFRLTGTEGRARFIHPLRDSASTLLKLGGTLTFSPELRALGRLLSKLADLPLTSLEIVGRREPTGNLVLSGVTLDSPQLRISGRGGSPASSGVALFEQPVELDVRLAAKDEMAVILGRMKLLEKRPDPAGYRAMRDSLRLQGTLGVPDPSPMYDVLASAVEGSRGTWAMIVRRLEEKYGR